MEVLAKFFIKGQDLGELHGFKAGHGSCGIPLLQFTDDTMVLVVGMVKDAKPVREILVWFELYIGLKVNARNQLYMK